MPDTNQLIQCPSCGHQNTPYVNNCIICDYSLVDYRKQPATRNTLSGRVLEEDNTVGQAGKRLGPLPDSDHLVDKKKSKGDTAKILQCKECGEPNRVGAFLCVNCGARLTESGILIQRNKPEQHPVEMPVVDDDTVDVYEVHPEGYSTQDVPHYEGPVIRRTTEDEMPSVIAPPLELDKPVNKLPHGCMKFTSWMILRFDVAGFDMPISIRPMEDKPMLIGRRHESLPVQPHIDLTPYLVGKHGVSRRHALLRLRGHRLELQDLNSTNGTSINGVRFSPKQSHQVRHEDIITFGQVRMHVRFVQQVRSASHGNTEELI